MIHCIAATFVALMLTACGGDGGGGGGGASTGSLSVNVTDAPVLDDVAVCIHFTGITLHHSDGDLIQIPYDPSTYVDPGLTTFTCDPATPPANNAVNLASLQGELSVALMDSVDVKAGKYNWIRLDVDESLSYVVDSAGLKDLSCPSCDGEQSGLKLNRGIVVPAGGEANFMIDFDLAKSLNIDPAGDYKVRPTLRLMDMTETGKITGTVDGTLITAPSCSVYVYAGHNAIPDDYHAADTVLTSTKVVYEIDTYKYTAAYLQTDSLNEPTPYTVALTCDTDDSLENEDNATEVVFTDGNTDGMGKNADVFTDQTTEINFLPVI